ncbi:MAG: heat-inducible transcriptional repressor HrcA [Candidatus Kapabacteria bacterium]|nr:heat-inducible transcriptional repressor HrcA [Candidatus Kapabacteria bacterium]
MGIKLDRRLNEREQCILQSIIRLYVLNNYPIGSRYLARYMEPILNLSPASIRNVMSDLEEMEFICHPHTSAGRIPTDKGYRYFVNSLKEFEQLQPAELLTVQDNLLNANSDEILKDASKILSLLSHYLGIVQIPHFQDINVQKIEIIPLSSTRVLLILALESNIVRTVNLEAHFEIEYSKISEITSYINERISGKSLNFIRENFKEILFEINELNKPLFRLFIDSADKIFDSRQQEDKILIAGARQLLSAPEFDDLKRVKSVIEIIENEDVIVHLLDKNDDNREQMRVLIGTEMENELMNDYSMVVTSYRIGSAHGSIGLIGPKRMDYSKMMSLVDFVSKTITGR